MLYSTAQEFGGRNHRKALTRRFCFTIKITCQVLEYLFGDSGYVPVGVMPGRSMRFGNSDEQDHDKRELPHSSQWKTAY